MSATPAVRRGGCSRCGRGGARARGCPGTATGPAPAARCARSPPAPRRPGARQPVAAGAALAFHGDEVGVEQPVEVLADRGGGDPGLARGQCAAVGQRHQHPGAAGLADERGDAGEVGVTGHATTAAPEHFGVRRSDRGRDWADGVGRHVRGQLPGPAGRHRAGRRGTRDRGRSRRRRHRAAVGGERVRAGPGGVAAGGRRARGRQRAPAGGPVRAGAVRGGVGGVRARADGRGARRGRCRAARPPIRRGSSPGCTSPG